ncbi:fluoride efflux transporter FluC [Kytococcus sedentarius]|uniref:Fluoride-specific ion channel FluC n=1 Tax=Kytococcus sedentarius (strain ATCC 14392 / DSM 20547 / JCM 11482 / CCUG 33030 / NBRC 15357 / NCTC 11040 / CCM 314 / 541) TaxID=478801 RepID=C7NFB4_KYTSD|nr:CrcB family protein [Kytococcus sedentarius]ACV07367.1 Integral membrane protein possibly involved in chromosome condensation [Kytococcus sedentarius DSM 20547]STX13789.1 camphor resistance protein CrcB [Kytococcus sedentarius]
MHGWRPWVLVGLGGAVGSVARVLLSEAWGTEAGVLAVNLVGAFLLGVADAVWRGRRPLTLAFWGTGVLGGFTTVSAWAVLMAGSWAWFWGGPALLGAGVLLAALGLHAGAVLRGRDGGPVGDGDAVGAR